MKKIAAIISAFAVIVVMAGIVIAVLLTESAKHRDSIGSITDSDQSSAEQTDSSAEPDTEPDKTGETTIISVISFKMLKSMNKNLADNIEWMEDGETLSGTVECPLDPDVLRRAKISIQAVFAEGGSGYPKDADVSFNKEADNGDGTVDLMCEDGCRCIVTDKHGNTKTYNVVTEYIKTSLPVVYIETDGGSEIESTEEYTDAKITIKSENTDDSIACTPIEIRGRGHSTWEWPKKPYQIKFDVKTPVLGMSAAKRWVLLANYNDKSLMRNNVALAMAEQLGFDYTPEQVPVDVFVNGEYAGVYTIGEKVEVAENRVEIETGDGLDCGFLIEMGGKEDGDIQGKDFFHLDVMKFMTLVYPESEDRTSDIVNYLQGYMQKAENAVLSLDGYDKYIDVASLIDWMIMTELTYNLDGCFRRSCYFTKDAGGKLVMGPMWDYDTSFGNMWKDYGNYEAWASLSQDKGFLSDNWIVYLMRDSSFKEKLSARWEEKKDSLLSAAMNTIDELYGKMARSAESNFRTWDILGKVVGCEPALVTKYNTYELQVEYLRTFIRDRWEWIDKNV